MLVLMSGEHGENGLVRGSVIDIKRRARLVQVCLRFCWARQKRLRLSKNECNVELHTFQSNGGKESGFGCPVRERKKE